MRALVVAATLTLFACGPPPRPPVSADAYPGALAPSETLVAPAPLGRAFLLRQRIRAVSAEGTFEFEAVLQLHDGTLTVLGLGPGGRRGFVLTQRGDEVTYESQMPRELPFPPRFMLLDVHRTWFAGLPDGEREAERDGERVTEARADGRLTRRAFERVNGEPDGVLEVTFSGGGDGEPPAEVVLDNRWFGYRLEMTTLEWRAL